MIRTLRTLAAADERLLLLEAQCPRRVSLERVRISRGEGTASPSIIAGRRAFTLIELMVVIGLIVLIVGGLALSLGESGGNALASAQKEIGSLVGSARAQAALNQTEARVVVYAARPPSGDSTKSFRLLQVFAARTQGSNIWDPVGEPVYLPAGVYVVPILSQLNVAQNVTWLTNPSPVSTFTAGTLSAQPTGTAFGGTPQIFYFEFGADGAVKPATSPYNKFVVGTAVLSTTSLPQFNNAGAVRGVLIRPTGAVTFANDATSF